MTHFNETDMLREVLIDITKRGPCFSLSLSVCLSFVVRVGHAA